MTNETTAMQETTIDLVREVEHLLNEKIEACLQDLVSQGTPIKLIRLEHHHDGSTRVVVDGVSAKRFYIDYQGLDPASRA